MKDINKLINEYKEVFGDEPPIIMCVSDSDPKYVELIEKALKSGSPISWDDIDKAFANTDYDMVLGDKDGNK